MSARGQKIAGTVVVIGLALALAGPLVYGIYDVVKAAYDVDAPTASQWIKALLMRHPIVGICAGFAAGVLAGHFGWWQTPPRDVP